jgi:polysaccharide pyruvyl transferase WcaK-like protein
MKIGILTFHRAQNYGALLQTYALLTYLKRLGHKTEIIDYWPNYHENDYKILAHFHSKNLIHKISSIFYLIASLRRTIIRIKKFKHFIESMFSLPNKPLYRKEEDLNEIDYDVVIYGSDQIWRNFNTPCFKGFDSVYFGVSLGKVKKKITYAASMGIIRLNQIDKNYLNLLFKNFDSISVREENLKQLVDDIAGKDVTVVLDPVFLLDQNDWSILSKLSKSKFPKDYILFYQLFHSNEAIELTNVLQQYYGYSVIEISSCVEPFLIGERYVQTCNPFDFISLIANAKIVVTTSFHGLAFALIFEKQFYSLGMQNNSARAQTILKNLNISDRYIVDVHQINIRETINYIDINTKLAILKELSNSYLIKALEE